MSLCRTLAYSLCLLALCCASVSAKRGIANDNSPQKHEQYKAYYRGAYFKDIEKKLVEAKEYLDRQLEHPRKTRLAIIFDIDETALSNFSDLERLSFTQNIQALTGIFMLGQAQAIPPVLALYQHAIEQQVAVFFVSERPNTPEIIAATTKNLQNAGFTQWEDLFLKPIDAPLSVQDFKMSTRRRITANGFDIVLNIGDQDEDLQGGYAEARVKLPNPFMV